MLVVVFLLLLVAAEAFDARVEEIRAHPGRAPSRRRRRRCRHRHPLQVTATAPPARPLHFVDAKPGAAQAIGGALRLRRRRQQRLLQPEVDRREVVRVRLEHLLDSPGASPPSAASSLALRQSLARARLAARCATSPPRRTTAAASHTRRSPSPSLSTHLLAIVAGVRAAVVVAAVRPRGPAAASRACACSSLVPRSPACGRERPSEPRRGRMAAATRSIGRALGRGATARLHRSSSARSATTRARRA